jgi:hypothetical protein
MNPFTKKGFLTLDKLIFLWCSDNHINQRIFELNLECQKGTQQVNSCVPTLKETN